ncbi:MAG: class I SAM-dependent methyltransferase [Acidimicrobiales bacterium]
MELLTDVRDISRLAYGFIASKALFAALNVDLFAHLTEPTSFESIVASTSIAPNRLRTLLAALTSVGVIGHEGDTYVNAPATNRYLVRGGPAYFGDYYRFQIDRQIYPSLRYLDAGLAGDTGHLAYDAMEGLVSDPVEAEAFSRAQHAGSMGPAVALTRTTELGDPRRLLDVAGGSGAFSITLCGRYPLLHSTIIDFPTVIDVARRYVDAAGLTERIALVCGNALDVDWPEDQDVVLLSYLLSAVGEADIPTLVAKAFDALRPGGTLLVHDFMLDDSGDGPALAALWFTTYLAGNPATTSFSAGEVRSTCARQGFVDASDRVLIDEITKVVSCTKPAAG